MSVNNINVKSINDLSSTPSLQDTDNLLAQTSSGFKKVPISQLKEEVSVDTSTFAPTTLLKDTVGWTRKNLLPYPYQRVTSSNGVTWTDNGDGTITADGTATANSWVTLAGTTSNPAEIPNSIKKIIGQEVILSSGEETNGVGIRIDFFDSNKEGLIDKNTGTPKYAKFVIPSNSEYIALQCFVYSGQTVNNLTFYPMLRRADIADDTWEPYHESVEEEIGQLTEDVAKLAIDFDTVEDMEAAIEADEIPEGATIYIPGGSGGGGADVGLSIVNGAVCITYETTTNGTGGA